MTGCDDLRHEKTSSLLVVNSHWKKSSLIPNLGKNRSPIGKTSTSTLASPSLPMVRKQTKKSNEMRAVFNPDEMAPLSLDYFPAYLLTSEPRKIGKISGLYK